mmetsp:Transcript_53906/g.60235  ORF Transcript_53906/g.60235 Transcript_53906/m.60235 type:complete len:80 (-) Transcript_53906:225-464(-)
MKSNCHIVTCLFFSMCCLCRNYPIDGDADEEAEDSSGCCEKYGPCGLCGGSHGFTWWDIGKRDSKRRMNDKDEKQRLLR